MLGVIVSFGKLWMISGYRTQECLNPALVQPPLSPEVPDREKCKRHNRAKGTKCLFIISWTWAEALMLLSLGSWAGSMACYQSLLRHLCLSQSPVWLLESYASLTTWDKRLERWEPMRYKNTPLTTQLLCPRSKHGPVSVLELNPTRSASLLGSSPPTCHKAPSSPLSKWPLESFLPVPSLSPSAEGSPMHLG